MVKDHVIVLNNINLQNVKSVAFFIDMIEGMVDYHKQEIN